MMESDDAMQLILWTAHLHFCCSGENPFMPPASVEAFTNVVGYARSAREFREMVEKYFATYGGIITEFRSLTWTEVDNSKADEVLLEAVNALKLNDVGIGTVYSYRDDDENIHKKSLKAKLNRLDKVSRKKTDKPS